MNSDFSTHTDNKYTKEIFSSPIQKLKNELYFDKLSQLSYYERPIMYADVVYYSEKFKKFKNIDKIKIRDSDSIYEKKLKIVENVRKVKVDFGLPRNYSYLFNFKMYCDGNSDTVEIHYDLIERDMSLFKMTMRREPLPAPSSVNFEEFIIDESKNGECVDSTIEYADIAKECVDITFISESDFDIDFDDSYENNNNNNNNNNNINDTNPNETVSSDNNDKKNDDEDDDSDTTDDEDEDEFENLELWIARDVKRNLNILLTQKTSRNIYEVYKLFDNLHCTLAVVPTNYVKLIKLDDFEKKFIKSGEYKSVETYNNNLECEKVNKPSLKRNKFHYYSTSTKRKYKVFLN